MVFSTPSSGRAGLRAQPERHLPPAVAPVVAELGVSTTQPSSVPAASWKESQISSMVVIQSYRHRHKAAPGRSRAGAIRKKCSASQPPITVPTIAARPASPTRGGTLRYARIDPHAHHQAPPESVLAAPADPWTPATSCRARAPQAVVDTSCAGNCCHETIDDFFLFLSLRFPLAARRYGGRTEFENPAHPPCWSGIAHRTTAHYRCWGRKFST